MVKNGAGAWPMVSEMKFAEELLAQEAQREHPFQADQMRNLQVFEDSKGLLRYSGRIDKSELSDNAKRPILLPRQSRTTDLIVLAVHEHLMHAKMPQVLAEVRQRYWIPRGRAEINRILRKCFRCRRENAKPFEIPPFPQLPSERVRRSQPFKHAAVDYMGPLKVPGEGPRTSEPQKIWIALFTCLATRAVHMEMVDMLSAQGFLRALRRFVSRRGRPSTILSDNATNFVSAAKTLGEVWNPAEDPEVLRYSAAKKIVWKFNPPEAPWMGGVVERLVGIVKKPLHSAIGRKVLDRDELETLMVEVEAVVNSRPLLYVEEE